MKIINIGEYYFKEHEVKEIFESFINKLFPPKYSEKWISYSNPIIYIGGHSNHLKKAKGTLEIGNKKLIFEGKSFFYKMELEIPFESIRAIEIKTGEELENTNGSSFQHKSSIIEKQVKYLTICYSESLDKKQRLLFELSKRAENELANLESDIEKLKKKSEKSKTQFEPISKNNLNHLMVALIGYLGGFRASPYGVEDAVLGIVDPIYGTYRQMLKRRIEERQNDPKSNSLLVIEKYYTQYPQAVRAYLVDVSMRFKEKMVNGMISERGVVFKKRILELMNTISRKCSNCGEEIPKDIQKCPYCDSEVSILSEEKEVADPLRVLKHRLAKGEISIKQYNDLKKILES